MHTPRRFLAALLLGLTLLPGQVHAQVEVSAGVLIVPNAGPDATLAGPVIGVSVPVPGPLSSLRFDVAVGRTDFTVLGQDYHDDHYALALSAGPEVAPGVSLRLGIGAYGEHQTVEGDPSRGGGDNWTEMVVPALVLSRPLTTGRTLVFTVSDAILGPVDALFDPSEFDVEHRIRLLVGVRF